MTRNRPAYLFFTPTEAALVEAAVDLFIPADELTPSGTDCGVVNYIDRQLLSGWGQGERMYRMGPWKSGTPQQGPQLPLVPAEVYRTALGIFNSHAVSCHGAEFPLLPEALKTGLLTDLEQGRALSENGLGRIFFEMLFANTMEGFFSDPVHGGNRGMVAWKMIGYPGAPADYSDDIVNFENRLYGASPRSVDDYP